MQWVIAQRGVDLLFEQMVLGNYEIAMVTPASTGDEVGDKGKKDGCVLM